MKVVRLTIVNCLLMIFFIGCNNSENSTTTHSGNGQVDGTKSSSATIVTPSNVNSQSPAFPNGLPVDPNASPSDVVSAFLGALREGDDQRAAALLTDIARAATEREQLTVQPPGSPSAQFSVGEAQYVSEEKDGAHVSSTWSENDENGEPISYQITWILKRQKQIGWRIKGMATQLTPEQPHVFLDFENPAEMLAKLQEANDELAKQNEVRQAQNPGSSGTDSPVNR